MLLVRVAGGVLAALGGAAVYPAGKASASGGGLPRGKEKRRGRRMLGAGARRRGRWSGVCLPSGRSVGRLAALGRRGAPPLPGGGARVGRGGRVQGWPDQPASASARAR